MKILLLYPYPVEQDGQSLQGHYLKKGLEELGVEVMACDRKDKKNKVLAYKNFKPDYVIGVGYWADTPDLIHHPIKSKMSPVPWFNADGWIANYHEDLNTLPILVATSNWVKSTYIRDGIKEDNIRVCPIGFDPDIFHPLPKTDSAVRMVREMLNIGEDEKMILTAGGDATSKGAQEMIQALAKVDQKYDNWTYVCKVWDSFSSKNHGKEEKALVKSLGLDKRKIIYLKGELSPKSMNYLINACDIYAAPSRLEGFGMIQLEAQACGKPVISINVGGPRDTIVHEKTGFLADVAYELKLNNEWATKRMGFKQKHVIEFPIPKTFAYRANVDQLADFTLKLLENDELRKEMGQSATKHALENFEYKVVAQKMLNILNEKANLSTPETTLDSQLN